MSDLLKKAYAAAMVEKRQAGQERHAQTQAVAKMFDEVTDAYAYLTRVNATGLSGESIWNVLFVGSAYDAPYQKHLQALIGYARTNEELTRISTVGILGSTGKLLVTSYANDVLKLWCRADVHLPARFPITQGDLVLGGTISTHTVEDLREIIHYVLARQVHIPDSKTESDSDLTQGCVSTQPATGNHNE